MVNLKTPKNVGALGNRVLQDGLYRVYQEMKGGPGSFGQDLSQRILNTEIQDPQHQDTVTLQAFAKRHGCETQLGHYLKEELSVRKSYLARALDLTTSLKNGLDDLVEGTEAAVTLATAPTGAGAVAAETGAEAIEIPLYAVAQTIYVALAGALGFSGPHPIYSRNLKGLLHYSSDMGKSMLGEAIDLIPAIGTLAKTATTFDDLRPRIAASLAKNVKERLFSEIKLKPKSIEDTLKGETHEKEDTPEKEDLPPLLPYSHANGHSYQTDIHPTDYYQKRAA